MIAPTSDAGYNLLMAKTKEFNLGNPSSVIEDEDEKTLAAIDEGILDAEADRTTTIEEVRKIAKRR
jgi:predicted transcriptional regulator